MNYVLYYRNRIEKINNIKNRDSYIRLLKENNIFLEIPKDKIEIPHAF